MLKLLGTVPLVFFIATIFIVNGFNICESWESPLLLLLFNFVFISLLSFVVSYISLKSYLKYSSLTLLLMGAGLLSLGLGGLLGALLRSTPEGANNNVTLFNIGVFVGSIFQAAGAVLTFKGQKAGVPVKTNKLKAAFLYSGLSVLMFLVAVAAYQNVTPKFFLPEGPTLLRQAILGTSIALLAISSFIFMVVHYRSGSDLVYWYALALASIAIGLFAILIQQSVGCPLGWIGRAAQYMGGIYFMVAILKAK